MNATASTIRRASRMLLALAILAGILAGPPQAAQARTDTPLDLAALILHSDDLDWLLEEMGLMVDDGWPYGQQHSTYHTSIDEAVRHEIYAPGRGGFTLDLMGEEDATDLLEDAGWLRSQSAILFLPEPGMEGYWSLGVSVTIEEFATEEGAETAMAGFDDVEMLEELALASSVSPIDPAPELEGANVLAWKIVTSRYDDATDIVTLWAQVDTMVVSVALMHSSGYVPPNPDHLVPLVELQLKRIELADYLYQPGLSDCAPEFQENEVADNRAEYTVLNGKTFSVFNDTFDDLEAAQADIDDFGLVDSYRTNQSIDDTAVGAYDGTMWFRGQVRIFTDDDAAADFLAETGEMLETEPEYSNVEQLDDYPELGDGATLFNYDAVDDFAATIIYVQIDNVVFSIRLGSMTDYQPEAVIELAEAQLERMEDGDCDEALELPDALLDGASPSTSEALLTTRHA
jgi:hypothetical protein